MTELLISFNADPSLNPIELTVYDLPSTSKTLPVLMLPIVTSSPTSNVIVQLSLKYFRQPSAKLTVPLDSLAFSLAVEIVSALLAVKSLPLMVNLPFFDVMIVVSISVVRFLTALSFTDFKSIPNLNFYCFTIDLYCFSSKFYSYC